MPRVLVPQVTGSAIQLPSDEAHHMMSFKGFVTGHPFTFPVDNVIDCNIEITLDGAVSWGTFVPEV